MNSGCPSAKWISVFLLLICLCAHDFNTYSAKAQARSDKAPKVSPDLLDWARGPRAGMRVPVIIQLNDTSDNELESVLPSYGGRLAHRFRNFNTAAVDLP